VNKSQLIEALAGRFDGNKKQAGDALEAVLDTIMRELVKGEKVAITGFGAFERVVRPSRMVRNPRTGERKRAKKTAVPRFKAGAELKAVVSGDKKLPKLAATTTKAAAAKSTASKATSSAAKKTTAKRTATKAAPATAAKKSTARATGSKKTAAKAPAKTAAKRSTAKATTARTTAAKSAKKAPAKTATKTTRRTTKKS
jgi:DNA-binding protein HU-beta